MTVTSARPLVMILAGLQATGKSTALREALHTGHPLFGDEAGEAFRSFRPPPVATENGMMIDERLRHGYWVHEVDLFWLHSRKISPAKLVVHFDLFWYLWAGRQWLEQLSVAKSEQDFIALLHDERRIALAFRDVFGLHPLRGSKAIVQLLKPPYGLTCKRWKERTADASPAEQFQRRHIYDGSTDGQRMYDRISAAWQLATTRPWELGVAAGNPATLPGNAWH